MSDEVRLYKLTDTPDQIVISKVDGFIEGGAFFLDFSRPLKFVRWLGFRNSWVGPAVGVFVPVVHQGEARGGYVVGVDLSDGYFAELRSLWKQRYPRKMPTPLKDADGLTLVTDFATQFPNDCR